jgi:hypothetical protein
MQNPLQMYVRVFYCCNIIYMSEFNVTTFKTDDKFVSLCNFRLVFMLFYYYYYYYFSTKYLSNIPDFYVF